MIFKTTEKATTDFVIEYKLNIEDLPQEDRDRLMEIIKENKENENLNFLQKILNEYGIVQSSEPSESYNFVLEEINSVENKEIIFNSDKFHRRLLILSRKSEIGRAHV